MAYEIKEVEGKFRVQETFKRKPAEPLYLEKCDTKEEAEKAVKQWEARDKLDGKALDFVSDMEEEFGDLLEKAEIREIIRATAE